MTRTRDFWSHGSNFNCWAKASLWLYSIGAAQLVKQYWVDLNSSHTEHILDKKRITLR